MTDQPTTPPAVEVPKFKLVEKRNVFRTYLPTAAVAVSTLAAFTAAAYFAAQEGAKRGVNGMTVLLQLSQEAADSVKDVADTASEKTK